MLSLPAFQTLRVSEDQGVLRVGLHRPEARNAINLAMIEEIGSVLDAIAHQQGQVRVLLLRGEGGHFCAGADVRDMTSSLGQDRKEGQADPVAAMNRRFGTLMGRLDRMPVVVVAVLEGTVLGGGLGMACVADVTLARADARLGLPEATLGLPPAQIAPFLVRRIGLYGARRLALTGAHIGAREAEELGLVHYVCEDSASLEAKTEEVIGQVLRCGPSAIAVTKALMNEAWPTRDDGILDRAAEVFASAVRSAEGQEGMMAFLQRRTPGWAREGT